MNTLQATRLEHFCSVTEAADLLGVNRATILRWIQGGTLTAVRIGRIFLIPREQIGELARENAGRAAAAMLPALTLRALPGSAIRATFTIDPHDPGNFVLRWEYEDLVMTAKCVLDQQPREWGSVLEKRRQSTQLDNGEIVDPFAFAEVTGG